MKIFFSGPLTNLANPEKTKEFYHKLDDKAKEMGFETFWAFIAGTDPIKHPDVSPHDVYLRDIQALDESQLMISYVGEPSTGTGIEIEHAYVTNKPVVILYEKEKHVSRMLRGCPAVKKEIIFENEDDAVKQLSLYLSSVLS